MYKRNNVWYAYFVYKGQRYVKSLNVTSKSAANELEEEFKTEVRSGEYQKKKVREKHDVKFETVLKDYLEKESIFKKSHRRNQTSKKHLEKFFVSKKLSAITPDDVIDYKFHRRDEIIAKKKRPVKEINFATVNRELALLRRVYNWYGKQKRLKLDNPESGVEFFPEKERTRVMTDEEERRFFEAVGTNRLLRDVVILALCTGLRKAEILNLRREDVAIGDLGGFVVLKDTKNGESRKVMLT